MRAQSLGVWCVVALCAIASTARAQDSPRPHECSDAVTPAQRAALEQQELSHAYELPTWRLEAVRGNRTGPLSAQYALSVPVSVHIVRKSDGSGGMTQARVDSCLAVANRRFAGAGIRFYQNGATRFIDNTLYHDNVNTSARIDQLRGQDMVANSINVYFTCNLSDESGGLCGKSSFTVDAVQGIVYDTTCTAPDYPSTFPHELGHYLDLYHTHDTLFGTECPNGGNCATAGDKVCDTDADPDVSRPGWLSGCSYAGDTTLCGDTPTPDPTNLMSYGKACRTHFTGGQLDRALATLVNLRSNLIQAPGLGVVWVDYGFGGLQFGTYAAPYRTLSSAMSVVATGGTIVIKSGFTAERPSFTRAMTIDSFRGISTVGN